MVLRDISLIGFKNIAEQQLTLSEGINCLVGDNGAGKTNVLDAVHYLSMAKSMLSMTDSQSVRHGDEFFMLDGRFTSDEGRDEQVCCSYSRRSGKTLKRNGKEYDRLSDHVGAFPIVVVSPSDTALISDSAEERRRYLNSFISQIDRSYLAALIRYNAALAERNKLLKTQPEEDMIAIYDLMLCDSGEAIHRRRTEIVEQMTPLVEHYYELLSEDREKIDITYRSELAERPLAELLTASRQRDLINQYTTCGIHRDDLVLGIGGYPLRKYGSQGQQKSFLIALKLAQYTMLADHRAERPILLLDDLFDKLDMRRVAQLLSLVSGERFGQILITDCNKVRLQSTLDRAAATYRLFNVSEGEIKP
ncbi:MAG: DNA replication and repair protein RecF [Alistipes sp.]|nr:DNA replication and repair protein RecF [Alistipes sp.]